MKEHNSQPDSNSPLVSAVIVNYRSWDKLGLCLKSLINTKYTAVKLEVIVVDNCSDDGRLATYEDSFPTVNFILNKGNYGFANGCNTGANKASGKYLLFVNPDTEIPAGVIDKLSETITTYPPYSIVATQKRTQSGKYERVERYFPRWYTLTGLGKAIHRLVNRQQIKNDFAKDKDVVFPEWVSGSMIFIRRTDFEQLGGWNEKFWMYSEDVDLCKRATDAGGQIALLQKLYIIHNHGGSSRINPVTSALTKSEVAISRHVYLAEHQSGLGLIAIQTLLVIKSIIKAALIAIVSLIAFSHPKAKVSRLLFRNLISYYVNALMNRSWLSSRSRQHKNNLNTEK
ncbi:glycosyltransferase family 2 protein [Alteromonadaceae bacterium BrNp21-10]|nr:glycosyltransferase family 2 protein [Alteromonadaceae bacterium BrNp21-10]